MSNEVILLSDIPNQSNETYAARYAGPYVIKSKCLDNDIKAIVLDWFCFINDANKFFEYFEKLIDENTQVVGISTTFLYPPKIDGAKLNTSAAGLSTQANIALDLVQGNGNMPAIKKITNNSVIRQTLYLWHDTEEQLTEWFKKLRETLDKYNKNAKIILGGSRIPAILNTSKLVDESFALCKYVDYAILGMADDAVPTLVNKLKNNKNIEFDTEVNGIKYIFCDKEPWLAKSKIPDPIIYTKEDCFEKTHWAGIEVGRGCAFNCKFCYYEKRYNNKKDLKILSEELKRNYYEHGIQGYHITADCFNDNRKFVGDWAEMTAKLPFSIEWASYVRVDPFHKWPEMIDEMYASGYKCGWYGIETLSHAAGKACGKGLDPDKVKELLGLVKQKGESWTTAYFILGLPKETEYSLQSTLDWLLTQKVIDEIGISIYDVSPYIEELAGIVDFSEHSKNPQKYGFTKIEFEPEFYWEHEGLNIYDCYRINEQWKEALKDHSYTRYGGSAHAEYVRIRDVGLTHKEAVIFMKTKFTVGKNLIRLDTDKKKQFKKHIIKQSESNIKRYYENFLQINRVR